MPHNNYRFNYDEYGNTREIVVLNEGLGVCDNSFTNKGTTFTMEERDRFGLHGVLRLPVGFDANVFEVVDLDLVFDDAMGGQRVAVVGMSEVGRFL